MVPEQEDSEFIYGFWKFGEEKLIHSQAQKVEGPKVRMNGSQVPPSILGMSSTHGLYPS